MYCRLFNDDFQLSKLNNIERVEDAIMNGEQLQFGSRDFEGLTLSCRSSENHDSLTIKSSLIVNCFSPF